MRKDKKSWDYQPPQQIALKEKLELDRMYSFKEIRGCMKESFPDLPGTAVESYLKTLEKLGDIVKVVTEDGPRFRNTQNLETVVGIVQWQPKGHALLLIEDEAGNKSDKNIFLSRKEAGRVLNGEKVRVKRIPALWRNSESVGEDEGIVIEVIESKPCHIVAENVGTTRDGWVGAVRPLETMFNSVFRISERHETRLSDELQAKVKDKGAILSGQLRRSGSFDRFSELYAFFDVKNVLGTWNDYGIETKIGLEWMQAEDRFYSNVLAEAHRVSTISIHDLMKDHGRKDLRKVPFVTIDGATTKDFDDAISAEKTEDGWKVFVAIADVSRYVSQGSLLDEVAKKRTTTLYMPHKAVPMLPEILSNGVCSLNPHVERAAMVCEIDITHKGEIKNANFYPAIMQSHARLLYDEVDKFIHTKGIAVEGLLPVKEIADENINLDKFDNVISNVISSLAECASLLRTQRNQPEFERIPEIIPVLGENGKATALKIIDEMTPANKLVEEFMLLTNYKAACFLAQSDNKAVLYRNQKSPEEGQTLLKSAKYETESYGHYGLGQEHYLHFTSPIRRYPDLLAHRAIKQVLGYSEEVVPKLEDVVKMGKDCTEVQRLSKGASNKARQWLIMEYASRNKGLVEAATIMKDMPRGWVVYGNESKISGYIPKPDNEEEREALLKQGLAIEIDRVDMFGEKVFLKVKPHDYLLVNETTVSVSDTPVDTVRKMKM